jgi:hypothetical protein
MHDRILLQLGTKAMERRTGCICFCPAELKLDARTDPGQAIQRNMLG